MMTKKYLIRLIQNLRSIASKTYLNKSKIIISSKLLQARKFIIRSPIILNIKLECTGGLSGCIILDVA